MSKVIALATGANWWDVVFQWGSVFVHSHRWSWPLWVPLGSMGTAGALIFLAAQLLQARRQSTIERQQKRDDERHDAVNLERSQTPYLVISDGEWRPSAWLDLLDLHCTVRANGGGIALGPVANLFLVDRAAPSGVDPVGTGQEAYIGSGSAVEFVFRACRKDQIEAIEVSSPALVRGRFKTMLDAEVKFEVEAIALPDGGLKVRAETYRYSWPWDLPAPE